MAPSNLAMLQELAEQSFSHFQTGFNQNCTRILGCCTGFGKKEKKARTEKRNKMGRLKLRGYMPLHVVRWQKQVH